MQSIEFREKGRELFIMIFLYLIATRIMNKVIRKVRH